MNKQIENIFNKRYDMIWFDMKFYTDLNLCSKFMLHFGLVFNLSVKVKSRSNQGPIKV